MSASLLCSFREAARTLGVCRNKILPKLIHKGLLRPVTILGRRFIPREQLEQLARHGENPSAFQGESPKRKRGRGGSIADLKIV